MSVEIVVPALGESVTEATVAKWLKSKGESVKQDEPVVELETDKVSVEVNAAAAGVIEEIRAEDGAEVEVGAVLGTIAEGGAASEKAGGEADAEQEDADAEERSARETAARTEEDVKGGPDDEAAEGEAREAPGGEAEGTTEKAEAGEARRGPARAAPAAGMPLAPAVRKLVEDHDLDPGDIPATGKDGRLTKGDVLAHLDERGAEGKRAAPETEKEPKREAPPPPPGREEPSVTAVPGAQAEEGPREERVRMTRLRRRIAERLKEAQNTAAMLTTFNETDMSAVMDVRARVQDAFQKRHGVKLGFMSFFVKACIVALREIPEVNAEIDGDEIVYKNHYDIGVAVGTDQGLVVPVVRDADRKGFAEIEAEINELARRARGGELKIDELTGGTFTITNGGIYGSLQSTPILNPPQSGILGMHAIKKRPVAVGDDIEVRPMMNLALSYDHRIVDGREAVAFLVRVKECVEDPERILLDV